jgi:hypothetical protein
MEDQLLVPGRSSLDVDDLTVLVRLLIKILSTCKKLTSSGFHWSFSVGITGFTNSTNKTETTSCRTILSPIKNHLQVQCIPLCLREQSFQISLSLDDVVAVC